MSEMSPEEHKFEYKRLDDMLIASIRAPLFKRDELKERFERLKGACGEKISGPGMIVYHWDTDVKEGLDIEAAYPVTEHVESEGITSRTLEGFDAFTTVHKGPYDQISTAFRKLHEYRASRGLAAELNPREVYLTGPFEENPEDNVTELQTTIHPWERRFKARVKEVLGEDRGSKVLQGAEKINPFSPASERSGWVMKAIERLDELADEDQKCAVISKCAHDRPLEDIQRFKEIFQESQDIDKVLEVYGEDLPWLEKPYREGRILYTSKPPANREAYDKAVTQEELIKAACFCPIVKAALEKMPRTFCYCGAGWAEQLWSEVVGLSVKVDIVETVVDGGRMCKFAVHLPESAVKA
ncbi:MAG: GyrI-like domain-containing protein [Candidatus Thorarchaeota archaeon]|jgi:effector-binding domain-containing protein